MEKHIPSPNKENQIKFEILEISSGSGQHTIEFCTHFGDSIRYQPTEYDPTSLISINEYIKCNPKLNNINEPKLFDICDDEENHFTPESFDMLININMSKKKNYFIILFFYFIYHFFYFHFIFILFLLIFIYLHYFIYFVFILF